MELIQRVGEVITPVFLIVALGWLYGRRHRSMDLSVVNRLVLDVMTPLLVYSALASRDFHLAEHSVLLAGGALLIAGSGAGGWLIAKLTHTSPRTLVPVVMFNNCGNMGLPLALFAFGPAHFGAAVALFAMNNLLHFSLGARITSQHARTRDVLFSPIMIGTVLGFLSALTELRPPPVLLSGMKLLGDSMLPLLLFTLGVRLVALRRADVPLGLLGAFARPLVGLALALPLAWALGLEGEARAQLILFGALPPAVVQYLLAERYQQEPERVAAMILLGNALALLFIPLALAMAL